MKQIYHPYQKWEDFKKGMWRKETPEYEEKNMPDIIKFTGNHIEYGKAMVEVVKRWKFSCEHNLTNKSVNRKAWLGHAACCYQFGYPEYLVRKAWGLLTDQQRLLANRQAEIAIKHWELNQNKTNQIPLF